MEDESKLKAGHAQAGNYYRTRPVHVSLVLCVFINSVFAIFRSKSRRHAHRAAQERQFERRQELRRR